jgi:AcrR family transcriptional regulator
VPREPRAAQAVPAVPAVPADSRDRRTRLLDAGQEIFAERHFADVSAQEIAARAGVAHGLLFHYFGSKRNFYLAVLERFCDEAGKSRIANDAAEPARWLCRELDLVLDGAAERRGLFGALVAHGSPGADAEVRHIATRETRTAADRVIAKLAPERTSPLLIAAIITWTAAAGELGAQWTGGGQVIPKAQLRKVLIATLNATLRTVAETDPSASFDPDRFSPDRLTPDRSVGLDGRRRRP